MRDEKLKRLLSIVIENYIDKGDPIGSKFLHSLESTDYAPSTLRKYLNILEKEGLLYQPYNSAGRIPTVKWLSNYLDNILSLPDEQPNEDEVNFDVVHARDNLQAIVEALWEYADGAVVGFLREDEYYYLGINNILRESLIADHETTRFLVGFIESKELVQKLDARMLQRGKIYYSFMEHDEKHIVLIYSKVDVNGYDAVVSIIGPSRIDHKKNLLLLKRFLDSYTE